MIKWILGLFGYNIISDESCRKCSGAFESSIKGALKSYYTERLKESDKVIKNLVLENKRLKELK